MSNHTQTTPPPGQGGEGPQAQPAKRTWFARHKIITGILAVLGLFLIIGALGGGDDESPGVAAQPSAEATSAEEGTGSSASSPGSTADESAAEEDAAAEPEETEEPTTEEAAPEPSDLGLGEVVTVGDFEVTVTGTEGGITQVGDDMFGEEAQGQFVKVLVTVENTGDAAEYFLDSEQKLIDDSDRQHSTSSASYLLDEQSLFLTEINPGNRVEGVLLYDIPEDAVPTAIDLTGGFFGSPVRWRSKTDGTPWLMPWTACGPRAPTPSTGPWPGKGCARWSLGCAACAPTPPICAHTSRCSTAPTSRGSRWPRRGRGCTTSSATSSAGRSPCRTLRPMPWCSPTSSPTTGRRTLTLRPASRRPSAPPTLPGAVGPRP